MSDGFIIRAGFSSNAFMAGSACADISGTFTADDAADVVEMLKMTIRMVERQVRKPAPPEDKTNA